MRMEYTRIKFFSVENLKRKILPFLFTVMFIVALSKLYLDSYFNLYVLLSAAMTFGMYALFDFMSGRRKLVSVPIYMLLSGAVASVLTGLLGTLKTFSDFFNLFEWFMTGGETVETTVVYMLLIVIGFTFFIGSVTYYFSHVIYRLAIFTLISLVPCAIYVKAAQAVPTFLEIAIAGMNIAMYVSNYRREHVINRIAEGKNYAMTAYVDFTAAALLLAAIIPKPSTAPFYEKFEELTTRFSFWGRSGIISGEFTEHSGNADEYLNMDNRLIYIVSTNNPQYFKAQCFDAYDSANRYWICSESLDGVDRKWSENARNLSLSELYKAYSAVGHPIKDKAESDYEFKDESLYSVIVQAVDYPSKLLITPVRAADTEVSDAMGIDVLRTSGNELFPEYHQLPGSARYSIEYYDEKYTDITGWIKSGMCDMTMDEYGRVLDDMMDACEGSAEYDIVKAFKADYNTALNFAPQNYDTVSSEIQSIANSITAGLAYDYEKAEAIERYFHSGKFRYDIAYRAPEEEDTPEYFLNQSRKGTCSDFATAYCLIARAAGLTVRYVEGYVPVAAYSKDMYYIYTENAHAFPEVYIPGAGWKIYEPTVSDNSGAANGNNAQTETDYLSVFITCVAVFISIAAVAVLIAFMPQIEKALFRLKIKALPAEKGIILVYGRFASAVEKVSGIKTKTLTSRQLGAHISEKTGISADEIILPFEQVCYGELKIDKSVVTMAYECHRAIIKELKKLRKKNKKAK